ncbi:hypothetical protein O9993_21010 [Vibrio lentus]|nr:hypothetical protein [Vibrio lentus]
MTECGYEKLTPIQQKRFQWLVKAMIFLLLLKPVRVNSGILIAGYPTPLNSGKKRLEERLAALFSCLTVSSLRRRSNIKD